MTFKPGDRVTIHNRRGSAWREQIGGAMGVPVPKSGHAGTVAEFDDLEAQLSGIVFVRLDGYNVDIGFDPRELRKEEKS